ncbi:hypothetical protein SD427_05585 [Chryseobacterium sp. JJR-5R]|uniref:hypothetical protein n=1 Tax=Chryseobacterium sp. JJR-5R TaxID=3093923 RepID=UPI002A74ABBF|nr:hypothetical protein [Chryseobacterium sp. JJR-5R]WPO83802.1 hypothetical protein SD427_05585 [Chryseobacterium sp. JJR-5R]
MMNPDNIFAEAKCSSVQKQTVLGILLPKYRRQCFVLLNFGTVHSYASGDSKVSAMATSSPYQQWYGTVSFNHLVQEPGAEIVSLKEEADFDFSLDKLEKDSFTGIFI